MKSVQSFIHVTGREKDSWCSKERSGGNREARIVAVFGGVCLFKLAICYCRACGCCSRDEKERREGEHEGASITDGRQRGTSSRAENRGSCPRAEVSGGPVRCRPVGLKE